MPQEGQEIKAVTTAMCSQCAQTFVLIMRVKRRKNDFGRAKTDRRRESHQQKMEKENEWQMNMHDVLYDMHTLVRLQNTEYASFTTLPTLPKVPMHCFYIIFVPGVCSKATLLVIHVNKSTQRAFTSTKNHPTDLNTQAFSNSFTSRYVILSHVCVVCQERRAHCEACMRVNVICVLCDLYKAWSMSMTQSRRWHPPCLPSVKTRDTTSLHTRLSTAISHSSNHIMQMHTPDMISWASSNRCQSSMPDKMPKPPWHNM